MFVSVYKCPYRYKYKGLRAGEHGVCMSKNVCEHLLGYEFCFPHLMCGTHSWSFKNIWDTLCIWTSKGIKLWKKKSKLLFTRSYEIPKDATCYYRNFYKSIKFGLLALLLLTSIWIFLPKLCIILLSPLFLPQTQPLVISLIWLNKKRWVICIVYIPLYAFMSWTGTNLSLYPDSTQH